jgi:hypothetical protein
VVVSDVIESPAVQRRQSALLFAVNALHSAAFFVIQTAIMFCSTKASAGRR